MGPRATWIADQRTDDELIAAAHAGGQRYGDHHETATEALAVLLWRSGPELLERAIELTASSDWIARELGVDLLGRIHAPGFRDANAREAWSTPALRNGYLDETLPVLRALTATERNRDVIESLAAAFGHREDPRGIAPLAHLAEHADAAVREAAARALPMCSLHATDGDAHAVATARENAERIAAPLLVLAGDPVGDVRDWALFGLHLGELDAPEIRETFLAHVDDPHDDAATEALYGLANLGDERGIEPLRRRIEQGDNARILIEACELYGDARLVDVLQALRDEDVNDDDEVLAAALAACRENAGWQGPTLALWTTR